VAPWNQGDNGKKSGRWKKTLLAKKNTQQTTMIEEEKKDRLGGGKKEPFKGRGGGKKVGRGTKKDVKTSHMG